MRVGRAEATIDAVGHAALVGMALRRVDVIDIASRRAVWIILQFGFKPPYLYP